jgi:hypothetical protein
VIKSRRMSWAGHVASMGEIIHTKFMPENLKARDSFGDLGVDGRTIMKRSLGKYGRSV